MPEEIPGSPTASASNRCRRCGGGLRDDVAEGLCPRCVGAAAFAAALSADHLVSAGSPEFPAAGGTGHGLPVDAIEDFQLLEEIARGGMGVVYRARQKSLGREVALKLLRDVSGEDGTGVDRFRTEAEAAASLQHPHIVSIHGFGEYDGRPFYTMELIDGHDLAELTRAGPLPVRRAATLIAGVARAVQHAHDRGVLHRDLKPSNVLVDRNDEPHVTDFGIARRLGADSQLTLTGQVLGTPSYMSPEQAFGRSSSVSPATDIYSLGALLYHLVTGRAPFIGESPTMVLQQLERDEPVAPRVLNASIPRDLETIILKALAKEPGRRYPTAVAVAEELDRYLRHEPIQARPLSPVGRLLRWGRRRPAAAALSGLTIAFVATVVLGTLIANRRLETQRLAAEQVKNFLRDILSSPDPSRDGRDVRMVDLLQRAADRARKELADQPLVQAEIELTLGATYFQLSQYPEAEPLLRSAVSLYERHLPAGDWRLAEARGTLGSLLHWSGRSEEAFRELKTAIALLRRWSPSQDLRLASVLEDLGSAYVGLGRLNESEPILRECLAVCDRLGSVADPTRVAAYGDLATALAGEPSKREEYLHYLGEAIALNRRMPGGKVNLATGLSNLADEMIWSERFSEAEQAAREALELRKSLFGTNSVETAFVHSRLASVLYAATNLEAARVQVEIADRIERSQTMPNHRIRAFTLRIWAMIDAESGNLVEAERRLVESRQAATIAYGAESPSVAAIDGNLADLLARRGAVSEARTRALAALPGLRQNAQIYPTNMKLRQRLARLEELARSPSDGAPGSAQPDRR